MTRIQISQEAGKVIWYTLLSQNFPQFIVIHRGFGVVNKAEVDVFLELFCFFDYAKAFDCVDHNKLWKILKEMGTPDHLTCLLRHLYAGQEATVRTRHGTTD